MDYTDFQKYPIKILLIDESYNAELNDIKDFVISEIAYSGDVDDLEDLLPFFVFFRFCESRQTKVTAQAGETKVVEEFTSFSQDAQIRAWNIGVEKLTKLCEANTETANCIYLTEIGLI